MKGVRYRCATRPTGGVLGIRGARVKQHGHPGPCLVCPASVAQIAPEPAEGWIPATSAGMTSPDRREPALDRIGRIVEAGRRGVARRDQAVGERLVLGASTCSRARAK